MMATGAPGLWIDDRYRGSHGIGRYAQEVTSRLTVPWTPLGFSGAPANPLDAFRRVPRAVREGVIYSPGYGAFIGARRQILTIHDLIHLQVDWPGRAKYLAYYNGPVRRAVRRAGVVLTVSETSREAIREWIRDDTVDVVNAGIGCSAAFTREGKSASSAEPYILYVGNMRTHKNAAVLFDALARTPANMILRMLIPASEQTEARQRGKVAGIEARVEFIPPQTDDELAGQYRGAVATAFPSTLEGFGLPALESIMCGTPVLYWQGCASVAETVGDSGVAVADAGSADAWSEAFTTVCNRPPVVSSVAPEKNDWSRVAKVVSETLEAALP